MASETNNRSEDLGFLNFADEIYQVYRKRRRTALRHPDLTSTYEEIYGCVLEYSRLKLLPFIQFEKNSDRNKMIYLVVELDDVCTRTSCKYDYCKLLHTCDTTDKLAPIYPHHRYTTDQINKLKPQRLNIPPTRLIQRMKELMTGTKQPLSIEYIKKQHKKHYPNFQSHEPTSFGICMRFKSTFAVRFDGQSGMDYISYRQGTDNDYRVSLNQPSGFRAGTNTNSSRSSSGGQYISPWRSAQNQIPYNPSKSYLAIKISPKWTDLLLIKDLVRHISQHTGKHVVDAAIENRTRLGFFTARKRSVAEKFVKQSSQKGFSCWGRKVFCTVVAIPKNGQHQQNGVRVKIININSVMGERDFKHWVYTKTGTEKTRDQICDVHVVFGRVECGAEQIILSVDSKEDAKKIVQKLDKVKFRAFPLRFSHWKHPEAGQKGKLNVNGPKVVMNTKSFPTRPNTVNSVPLNVNSNAAHRTKGQQQESNKDDHAPSNEGMVDGKHEQSPATVSGESAELLKSHPPMKAESTRSAMSVHSSRSNRSRTSTRTPSPQPSLDEALLRSLSQCEQEMVRIKTQTDTTLTPRLVELSQQMVQLQANNGALLVERGNQIRFNDMQQEQNGIIREINANQALYHELMRKTEGMNREITKQKWKRKIGRLTTENLSVLFKETTMQIQEAQSKEEAEAVIGRILQSAVRKPHLIDLYVSLCAMIQDHCSQLTMSMSIAPNAKQMAFTKWMAQEPNEHDLTKTITAMMVTQTRSMFLRCSQSLDYKFVGVMELIAELYNANLLKINLIYKGVLNVVMSSNKNSLNEREMEGICCLLVKCGATLYPENRKLFEKCWKELMGHNGRFGEHLRISSMIEKVKNMKLHSDLKLLRAKYRQLEIRYLSKLTQCDMMRWDSDDVVNWIMDQNPQKYAKYMSALLKRTKSEGVDGSRLANLDQNNLHQLGITEFQDVHDVYECIQDLVSKQELNLHSQILSGEVVNVGGDFSSKECVFCEGGKQEYACIPCGHLCVCKNCKDDIGDKCPQCRNTIESVVRIYN